MAEQVFRVENGGDWNPGAEAAFITLVANLAHFLPLWLTGGIVGALARRRLAQRSASPAR